MLPRRGRAIGEGEDAQAVASRLESSEGRQVGGFIRWAGSRRGMPGSNVATPALRVMGAVRHCRRRWARVRALPDRTRARRRAKVARGAGIKSTRRLFSRGPGYLSRGQSRNSSRPTVCQHATWLAAVLAALQLAKMVNLKQHHRQLGALETAAASVAARVAESARSSRFWDAGGRGGGSVLGAPWPGHLVVGGSRICSYAGVW